VGLTGANQKDATMPRTYASQLVARQLDGSEVSVENMKGLFMMGRGQVRAGSDSDGRGERGLSAARRRLALTGIVLAAAAGLTLPVMATSAATAHAATAVHHAKLIPCPCTLPACQSGC
jgi:hypothetical protein